MQYDGNDDRTERIRRGRRGVLVSLGTAVAGGLAGCTTDALPGGGTSGDGSGGDGSGGDGSGSDGASGGGDGGTDGGDGSDDDGPGGRDGSGGSGVQTCMDIESGYLRFEPGERPFAYTCDYPEVFGDQSAATPGFDENNEGLFLVTLQPDSQDGEFLQLNLQQFGYGTTRDQATFPDTWDELTQTEFDGETVTAYLYTMTAPNRTFWGTYLPYEVDSRTLYFETQFTLHASPPDDEEVSNECVALMEETAVHVTESLARNPDATGLERDPLVPTSTAGNG